jgi:hypothetical protein
MPSCPACAADLDEAVELCPRCRTDLRRLGDADDGVTRAARTEHRSARPASPSSGWLSSSDAIDHGRFPPGTPLGGRYRIVWSPGTRRHGRGVSGGRFEARASGCIKFLPPDVDRDPARLTQLHGEVRMARQISHHNVCRVYDIDEVEGTRSFRWSTSTAKTSPRCCGPLDDSLRTARWRLLDRSAQDSRRRTNVESSIGISNQPT